MTSTRASGFTRCRAASCGSLRSYCPARGCTSRRRGSSARRHAGLTSKRLARGGAVPLAFQCATDRAGPFRSCASRSVSPGAGCIGGAALRSWLCTRRRTAELDTSAPRFRKPDRDRLFGGSCAMLAFADMVHLLAHEFAGLRGRRVACPFVPPRSFDGRFLRHELLSVPDTTQHWCHVRAQRRIVRHRPSSGRDKPAWMSKIVPATRTIRRAGE
jgi:hypothetical protein